MVLEATDRELERRVAIKLSRPGLGPELLRRFAREARTLANLEHPGVVRLYDHGVTEAEQAYLVMELIEGASLAERPPADPLAVMLELAEALEALHAAGLVHRDLKPANVLLDARGRAVLVDLGLVREEDRATLTATGQIIGTPAYMAPETVRGKPGEPAADWYAWGVTLYELLEGRPPYEPAVMTAIVAGLPLPPPRFSKVAPDGPVAALLGRMIADDPAARPASAREIRALVAPPKEPGRRTGTRPSRGTPPPRPRAFPWRVPVFVALVGLGAWLAPRVAPPSPPLPPPSSEPAAPSTRDVLAPLVAARLDAFPRGPEGVLLLADHTYTDHITRLVDRTLRSSRPGEEARWHDAVAAWLKDPGAAPDEELERDLLRVFWLEAIEWEVMLTYLRFYVFFRGPAIGTIFTPAGLEEEDWMRMPAPPGLRERVEAELRTAYDWAGTLAEGPPRTVALRRALARLLRTQFDEHVEPAPGPHPDVPERLALPLGELDLIEVFDLLASLDWMRATFRGACDETLAAIDRVEAHLDALQAVPADLLAMARAILGVVRFRNHIRCHEERRKHDLPAITEGLRALPPGWIELSTTWCITFTILSTFSKTDWGPFSRELVQIRRRAEERLRARRGGASG